MRSANSALTTALVVAAAAMSAGCEANWKFSPKGIDDNPMLNAVAPVVEQWQSQQANTGIVPSLSSGTPVEVRWTTAQRVSVDGKLKGWAKMSDGRQVKLVAQLRLSDEGWQLADLKADNASLLSRDWHANAVRIHDTMSLFMEGVREKSFGALYGHMSSIIHRRNTVQVLNDKLRPFMKMTVTGKPLAGRTPAFVFAREPGSFDKPDRLSIAGRYQLSGGDMLFQLTYVAERGGWKLLGLNVNFKPGGLPKSQATVVAHK